MKRVEEETKVDRGGKIGEDCALSIAFRFILDTVYPFMLFFFSYIKPKHVGMRQWNLPQT